MNRIDRLIAKAKPKKTIFEKLKEDNPFLGMSFRELLDCMCPHIPTELEVPKNGTLEKDKFNVALIEAIQKRNKSDSND